MPLLWSLRFSPWHFKQYRAPWRSKQQFGFFVLFLKTYQLAFLWSINTALSKWFPKACTPVLSTGVLWAKSRAAVLGLRACRYRRILAACELLSQGAIAPWQPSIKPLMDFKAIRSLHRLVSLWLDSASLHPTSFYYYFIDSLKIT